MWSWRSECSTLTCCCYCLWFCTQFWVWAFVCRLVQVRFWVCSLRFFSVAECYMTRRIFSTTFVSYERTGLSHLRLDRDVFVGIHFWTFSSSEYLMVSSLEDFRAHWQGAVLYFQSHCSVTEDLACYDIFHCQLIVRWAYLFFHQRERLLYENWSADDDRWRSLIFFQGLHLELSVCQRFIKIPETSSLNSLLLRLLFLLSSLWFISILLPFETSLIMGFDFEIAFLNASTILETFHSHSILSVSW